MDVPRLSNGVKTCGYYAGCHIWGFEVHNDDFAHHSTHSGSDGTGFGGSKTQKKQCANSFGLLSVLGDDMRGNELPDICASEA